MVIIYYLVFILEETASPSKTQNKRYYDFYKHSNVEEIKYSIHILEKLKIRILELLNEWPDHPNLQTVRKLYPTIRFITYLSITDQYDH